MFIYLCFNAFILIISVVVRFSRLCHTYPQITRHSASADTFALILFSVLFILTINFLIDF